MPPSPHTRLVMGKHAECNNCTTIKIILYESRASRVGTPMTGLRVTGVPYRSSLARRDGRRRRLAAVGRRRVYRRRPSHRRRYYTYYTTFTFTGCAQNVGGPRCEHRRRALSATASVVTPAVETTSAERRVCVCVCVCRIPFFVTVALRCVSSRGGARVVVTLVCYRRGCRRARRRRRRHRSLWQCFRRARVSARAFALACVQCHSRRSHYRSPDERRCTVTTAHIARESFATDRK